MTLPTCAGNEVAVGEILHRNHCREKINLATKLPHYLIKSIDSVEKMFQEDLRRLLPEKCFGNCE